MTVNIPVKFVVLFLLFQWNFGFTQDTISTKIILDSLDNEVYYITSKKQEPVSYYSPIFTPVCVDGTCYPIKINLFWDLGGNYMKYTLDASEILTKVEHLPFTEFDYGLLHRVLANSQSALANYTIYELTEPVIADGKTTNKSKVDGVTGATRPELQGTFVPDALYTSYTLWHLVQKPKTQLEEFTKNQILESIGVQFLLSNPQLGGQDLALRYLLKKRESTSVKDIFSPIIDTTDNELTIRCLELIPNQELETTENRLWLSNTYTNSDHSAVKKAILNKWMSEFELTALEIETVAKVLGQHAASFSRELIFLEQEKNWSQSVYYSLLDKSLHTTNMMRREKIKRLLLSREAEFSKKFKKKLKKTDGV